ncbi:outer membrane protein assembly factor BamC [Paraglaciecola aestuariivivens]
MTLKLQFVGIAIGTLLAACSSIEERELASGSFKYVQEQPGQKIKIPEGVDTPKFNDAYKLPQISPEAPKDKVGKNLSVLSPSLVLPVVAGSHVEEGSKAPKVWFDQVDDSQPLDTAIWNSLIRFLEKEGIGIHEFDKDNQRLLTDWIMQDEAKSNKWYTINKSERKVGQRFEFRLDKKPHGRTAGLSAKLVDYKEKASADSQEITQAKDTRRNEVEFLNQVVKNYEFELKVADVKRYRQIRQGLPMELGFDADGEAAFVVKADYDVTWPRLLLVLRKLGFDVKDYDKSNGLLFVKYNGAQEGWWSSLFSSSEDALKLDTKEYRIKVASAGENTSVTLLNEESQAFAVDKLTDLFATFSRTMAADDLDI